MNTVASFALGFGISCVVVFLYATFAYYYLGDKTEVEKWLKRLKQFFKR